MLNLGESAFDYRSSNHEALLDKMSPKALSLTDAPVAGAKHKTT